ncbi:recombinase family protein [Rubripirellula amarantea]|nr:hypothetical protein [Rubripirellula amarantea]
MLIISWMFATASLCAPIGCSNRAHSDLYQQRMASEIRVLEDQLYDADFQNRKLQDKLQRYEQHAEATRIPTPSDVGLKPRHQHPPTSNRLLDTKPLPIEAGVPVPVPDLHANEPLTDEPMGASSEPTLDHGFEDSEPSGELDIPNFDMGEPFDPNAGDNGAESNEGEDEDSFETLPPPRRKPLIDPTVDPTDSDFKDDAFTPPSTKLADPKPAVPSGQTPKNEPFTPPPLQPAPGGPMPPGEKDLKVDPIIPGEVTPPPPSGELEDPPGRILLPTGVTNPTGVPDRLRIHPSLSVGHRDGTMLDGATIVVAALDRLGRNVDLSQFDIEANLSVVVLDPTRDSSEARLGRWDFTPQQVAAMIAEDSTVGLEIPLSWTGKLPQSDKIIVHVRLRSDQDEMRCDAKLDLRERTAAATWSPRGE